MLDSGSSSALILMPDLAEGDSLASAFPRTVRALGRGVGGEIENQIGRAAAFSLGALRFDAPIVAMPAPGAGRIGAPGTCGTVGGELLARCRVTLDYSNHRVRIEPGEAFARPFDTDMSGASIVPSARGFRVGFVNPDTPAAAAGLQAGDLLIEIGGVAWNRVTPAALRQRLREEGHALPVRVSRSGRRFDCTLHLRRIL
jgi:membrane-associated protease RseP (regulator of RpoE activity)